jgi:hypothetical protein
MAFVGAGVAESEPGDPADRMRGAGRGYVGFARAHPGVFELMFRPERLDPNVAELAETGVAAFGQLVDLVRDLQDSGFHPGEPPVRLAGVYWAAMHGLAQLWIQGALAGATGEPALEPLVDLSQSLLLPEPTTSNRRTR